MNVDPEQCTVFFSYSSFDIRSIHSSSSRTIENIIFTKHLSLEWVGAVYLTNYQCKVKNPGVIPTPMELELTIYLRNGQNPDL